MPTPPLLPTVPPKPILTDSATSLERCGECLRLIFRFFWGVLFGVGHYFVERSSVRRMAGGARRRRRMGGGLRGQRRRRSRASLHAGGTMGRLAGGRRAPGARLAAAKVAAGRAHCCCTKSHVCTPNMFFDSTHSNAAPRGEKRRSSAPHMACRHWPIRAATSAVSACLTSRAISSCAQDGRRRPVEERAGRVTGR